MEVDRYVFFSHSSVYLLGLSKHKVIGMTVKDLSFERREKSMIPLKSVRIPPPSVPIATL
jgi:hypothetical protein